MIIKRIDDIENRKEFIEKNKDEKILIKNYELNDVCRTKGIINDCEEIDSFLQIEIGNRFFFISRTSSKCNTGCRYWLSDRTIEEIIEKEI